MQLGNVTVEEALTRDFKTVIYHCSPAFRNIAAGKVPKGQYVFDTGADVHICTDATLFKPNDPPEYTKIIGVEGRAMQAEIGTLLWLGRCLLLADCPFGLISSHVLESTRFVIEYHNALII